MVFNQNISENGQFIQIFHFPKYLALRSFGLIAHLILLHTSEWRLPTQK